MKADAPALFFPRRRLRTLRVPRCRFRFPVSVYSCTKGYRDRRLPRLWQNNAILSERRGERTTRIGSQETIAADGPVEGARYLTPGCTQVISFRHCYALLTIAKHFLSHPLTGAKRIESRYDGEGHSTPQRRRESRIGASRPRGGLKRTTAISQISRARTCDAVSAISGAAGLRANQAR